MQQQPEREKKRQDVAGQRLYQPPTPKNVPVFSTDGATRSVGVTVELPADLEGGAGEVGVTMITALADTACATWASLVAAAEAWLQDPDGPIQYPEVAGPAGEDLPLVQHDLPDKPYFGGLVLVTIGPQQPLLATICKTDCSPGGSFNGAGTPECVPGTVATGYDNPQGAWYYLWHDDNNPPALHRSWIVPGSHIWVPKNNYLPQLMDPGILHGVPAGTEIGGDGSYLAAVDDDTYLVTADKKYKFASTDAFEFGMFDASKVDSGADISGLASGPDIDYTSTYPA